MIQLGFPDSLMRIKGFEKYTDPKQRAITAIEKGAMKISPVRTTVTGLKTAYKESIEMGVTKPAASIESKLAEIPSAKLQKVAEYSGWWKTGAGEGKGISGGIKEAFAGKGGTAGEAGTTIGRENTENAVSKIDDAIDLELKVPFQHEKLQL